MSLRKKPKASCPVNLYPEVHAAIVELSGLAKGGLVIQGWVNDCVRSLTATAIVAAKRGEDPWLAIPDTGAAAKRKAGRNEA